MARPTAKPASEKPAPMARVYRGTPRNIAMLARALKRGELVAVPTETVYGLAGNALSPDACAAIFRAKGRPINDPLIAHIHDLAQLDQLAHRNRAAEKLAAAFWPGPLTLVLPKTDIVPALATSGLPSVAIRMPSHPLFRALLKKCGLPLVAPSANPFGYISPTSATHARDGLGKKIRHILDGGKCDIGVESTIIDLRDPRRPAILRPGKISASEIAHVLGVRIHEHKHSHASPQKSSRAELAPGMLSKHYSPRTPVILHAVGQLTSQMIARIPKNEAVILFSNTNAVPGKNIFPLSKKNNLGEAARNLFSILRKLDSATHPWKKIHAELADIHAARNAHGLALAINDRLTRAAAKR